ncbi:unnamed protein product [Mytilus edulis]|uniref:Ig-like domain-containing protein n=1 Tax=Mytilus edulis TaxID=6550 RepID=A0A8S3S0M0_MYTED|nr:unnamed protein product [Mytilus edulis]
MITTSSFNLIVAIRFLYQTDANILHGQEGKAMNISCATIAGHKTDKLSIKHQGITLSNSTSNIVTFNFIPDRHDNLKEYGKPIATPSNFHDENDAPGSKQTTFDEIFYNILITFTSSDAPAVQVVDRPHSFDCVAKGFPHKYIFNKWEHQSEQGEHIRFLDGLHNVTLNLPNHQLKYQITGRYICTVSNGIPDANGSLLQNGFKSFQYTDSLKSRDITGFIISSGIAAVILSYIIVNRICIKVNERLLRNRQRSSGDLHYHTYDEIGPISNQEVNNVRLATDQQGLSQQTGIISSSQTVGTQTDINNQLTLNYTTEAPSTVSKQEISENTVEQNVALNATMNLSSTLYTEEIRHDFSRYVAETITSSDGSGHNKYEDWSISSGTSRCSADSTESNMCSYNPTSFNINDNEYENPYQIIIQESQDTHQYSSISNQSLQYSGDQET